MCDTCFHAIANLEACHCADQFVGERVIDLVVHVEAIGADTGLPDIAEFGGQCTFYHSIQISVIKHDKRRIAAQFQ